MKPQQDSLFTSEMMRGTGQLDMLASISELNQRKAELKRTTHTFWEDPGHGWLEVSYADLRLLGIWGQISGYSYRRDDKVYLEEDMDAVTYLKAIWGNLRTEEYKSWQRMYFRTEYRDNIFIRNLKHYKP